MSIILIHHSYPMKCDIYNKLIDLMKVRFLRHKEYFEKDLLLVSSYRFIIKIIDSLNPIVYNTNEEQKKLNLFPGRWCPLQQLPIFYKCALIVTLVI